MRTGIANFTLDFGKCPPWLFERMVRLGRAMSEVIIAEYGPEEFIKRLADPVWFRLYYLYPEAATMEILSAMSEYPAFVPYLDLPVQHISSRILKKMGRSGNRALHRQIIDHFRRLYPDGEIRMSFIIGYPGENDRDITLIADFLEKNQVEKAVFFLFSPQEGTAAEKWKIYPDEDTAAGRINFLSQAHRELIHRKFQSFRGKITDVMIDYDEPGFLIGHRKQDAPDIDYTVRIRNPEKKRKVGELCSVRILDYFEYEFSGELI